MSFSIPRNTRDTTSPTCCAPWDGWRGSAASVSPRPIPRISRTVWSRPWRRRPPCASTCTCRSKAVARACSSGCCAATTGRVISLSWRRCAGRCPGGGGGGSGGVLFTSPYPGFFSDRVAAARAETPAVCEHVHLPVQSGSSRVLKRMLRRYDRARYLAVVAALRRAVPGIALTTDIIVGFPGETEEDFQETLSLVEEVGFDDAYMFKYSRREGTPATRLQDAVADDAAGERLQRLVALVRRLARQKKVALIGTSHEVLVEGKAKRGDLLQGRTRTNKGALLAGPDRRIWSYQWVRLTGTTGSTFSARLVEAPQELAVVG